MMHATPHAIRVILSITAALTLLLLLSAPGSTASYAGSRSPGAAAFPFYDGFESGSLGSAWTTATTSLGLAQVSSDYSYAGVYSLLLGVSAYSSSASQAAAILTIDLSAQTQVELDFWLREFSDENHTQDGVFISADSGANWYSAFSFNDSPYYFRHHILDLDAAVAANGLAFNDHFQVKFQFYDNEPFPADGYAIDELRLRLPDAPVPAALPFYDGFESGALGSAWTTSFTNDGRVQVGTAYPYAGSYSLLLDDAVTNTNYSLAAAVLTLDLSGRTQVELDFWWREFSDENHPEDGIFISDDWGAHWFPAFSFNNGPQYYLQQMVDLDAAAAANGLAFNDHFQVKFQFYDTDAIITDGYAIDELQVRAPYVPVPADFPFYDGFESGALGPAWTTAFTNDGVIQVSGEYPYQGDYGLLLSDPLFNENYSTAAAILTANLAGQADVMLDFWWREFSDENHAQDGVFVSDDGGATWISLYSFNNGLRAWKRTIIDLDAAATALGFSLNDHLQIKFQFYDNEPLPADGYAFDELQLRLNAPPELSWAGDLNYEQDGLDPQNGEVSDKYFYVIRYADIDSNPPAHVRLHILKGDLDITGSPFEMPCAAGDYYQGVLCTYAASGLGQGTDYSYYMVAEDDQGKISQPTIEENGPVVIRIYRSYLSFAQKDAGPPAGAPVLNPISNPAGDAVYTLTWTSIAGAIGYILEEDSDPGFPSPLQVESGAEPSMLVYASSTGTLYYRLKAFNAFGASGWSNTVSTVVVVPPEPRPHTGHWQGTNSKGKPVSFDVTAFGSTWTDFKVSADWSGCQAYGTKTYTITGPGAITGSTFSSSGVILSFQGAFPSTTTASGSYVIDDVIRVQICTPNGCWFCTVFFDQSGTWSATAP